MTLVYPKIKVLINKKLDKIICEKIINRKKSGIDFGGGIIKVHPELAAVKGEENDGAGKIINDYFDRFYTRFILELDDEVKNAGNKWNKKEKLFYSACDKYFNNYPWPDGKYEAYLSIISCNPRFLDDKTFQFYWKNKYGFPCVAAHEMLHFLFYDLVAKLLPSIDIQNEKVWEISEVFNGLIMSEEEFLNIAGVDAPHQYPDLIGLQEKLRGNWNKDKRADKFILFTLSYLK